MGTLGEKKTKQNKQKQSWHSKMGGIFIATLRDLREQEKAPESYGCVRFAGLVVAQWGHMRPTSCDGLGLVLSSYPQAQGSTDNYCPLLQWLLPFKLRLS